MVVSERQHPVGADHRRRARVASLLPQRAAGPRCRRPCPRAAVAGWECQNSLRASRHPPDQASPLLYSATALPCPGEALARPNQPRAAIRHRRSIAVSASPRSHRSSLAATTEAQRTHPPREEAARGEETREGEKRCRRAGHPCQPKKERRKEKKGRRGEGGPKARRRSSLLKQSRPFCF